MSTSVSRRSSAPVHPTRQQLEELDLLLKRMLDLPVNANGDEDEDAAPAAAPVRRETPTVASPPEPMRGPHHLAFARPSETVAEPPAVNYQTPEAEEADLKPRVVAAAPAPAERATISAPPPQTTVEKPQGAAGDWVPLTSSWRPSARTWKPLSDAWRQAQAETPAAPAAVSPPWVRDVSPMSPPEPAPVLPPLPAPPPRIETPQPALQLAPQSIPVNPAPAPAETASRRVAMPARALERAKRWKPMLPLHAGGAPWFLWPLVGFNAAFDACLLPWGPFGRWLRGPTGRALLGIIGLLCLTAAAAWAAAEWIGWTW